MGFITPLNERDGLDEERGTKRNRKAEEREPLKLGAASAKNFLGFMVKSQPVRLLHIYLIEFLSSLMCEVPHAVLFFSHYSLSDSVGVNKRESPTASPAVGFTLN